MALYRSRCGADSNSYTALKDCNNEGLCPSGYEYVKNTDYCEKIN